jgi:hypothetical protein
MNEDHLDLLQELVTTSYWRALKYEIQLTERGLIARLCEPIKSLEDLVAKEGNASRLAALRALVNDIEEKAERRAKQLRAMTPD